MNTPKTRVELDLESTVGSLAAHAPDDLKFLLAERERLLCRVAYLEGWKTQAETRTEGTPTS